MGESSSSLERVTFRHPFTLPGFDQPHAAGSFDVRTDREALDVSFDAFRVSTSILLADGPQLRVVAVKREDLDDALRRDALAGG